MKLVVREKGRGLSKARVGKGVRSGWGKRLLNYSCNPFMRNIIFPFHIIFHFFCCHILFWPREFEPADTHGRAAFWFFFLVFFFSLVDCC